MRRSIEKISSMMRIHSDRTENTVSLLSMHSIGLQRIWYRQALFQLLVDQVGPGDGVADDCPSGVRASTAAADGRIGAEVEFAMEDEELQEEEEEGEEEEDEQTMLQRATYASQTYREMTEDALEDMRAYDDDVMNEFQSTQLACSQAIERLACTDG